MAQADVFVYLGHVQFEKNNFQNRFKLNDTWMTMAVKSGICEIREKEYVNPGEDWAAIKRKLPKHAGTLSIFDDIISRKLWDTNVGIIERIANISNIRAERREDYASLLKGTERLVDICETHGATTYLSGPSGRNYLDISKFRDRGIRVDFYEPETRSIFHSLERLEACL